MLWRCKGSSAACAALSPDEKDIVLRSAIWRRVHNRPFLWCVEQAIDLSFVGFLTGTSRSPEMFACLVVRILQILPSPDLVSYMVTQDTHKYLRVVGLVIVRLIGNAEMERLAVTVALQDYRKIRVKATQREFYITHVDEICADLFLDAERTGLRYAWAGMTLIKRSGAKKVAVEQK